MNDFLYHKKRSLLQDSLLFRNFAIENKKQDILSKARQLVEIKTSCRKREIKQEIKINNNANNLKTK